MCTRRQGNHPSSARRLQLPSSPVLWSEGPSGYVEMMSDLKNDLFENFLTSAQNSAMRALLLDYDGTLAPFRADRMLAVPYPGVRAALAPLVGRPRHHLAIVSGR